MLKWHKIYKPCLQYCFNSHEAIVLCVFIIIGSSTVPLVLDFLCWDSIAEHVIYFHFNFPVLGFHSWTCDILSLSFSCVGIPQLNMWYSFTFIFLCWDSTVEHVIYFHFNFPVLGFHSWTCDILSLSFSTTGHNLNPSI